MHARKIWAAESSVNAVIIDVTENLSGHQAALIHIQVRQILLSQIICKAICLILRRIDLFYLVKAC